MAIALALMNRKIAPRGTSSSVSDSAFGSYGQGPIPLGFERAAHVLFHVIEDRLESSLEVGLHLFNVGTVADKILSRPCPS